MEIKVLGSGCSNCKKLYENVKNACDALQIKATIIYVTDILDIAKSGIIRTPGLIINGKIVSVGRVLSFEEAKIVIEKANVQDQNSENRLF